MWDLFIFPTLGLKLNKKTNISQLDSCKNLNNIWWWPSTGVLEHHHKEHSSQTGNPVVCYPSMPPSVYTLQEMYSIWHKKEIHVPSLHTRTRLLVRLPHSLCPNFVRSSGLSGAIQSSPIKDLCWFIIYDCHLQSNRSFSKVSHSHLALGPQIM